MDPRNWMRWMFCKCCRERFKLFPLPSSCGCGKTTVHPQRSSELVARLCTSGSHLTFEQ